MVLLLLVKALLLLVVLPILLITVHRLFIHPLAKYPGPLLARCTDLWAVYHGWKGDMVQTLERLHGQHGEFVRFGPNRISSNTIEALDAIYGFKANTRKSSWYYTFAIDPVRPSTHTVIDKAQHARKRRLVAQGLSMKSTKELEPHVIECVDVLCSKMAEGIRDKEWSQARDMSEWSGFFTVDVMGAMVFSKRFGLMEMTENRWLKDAVPLAARNKYACSYVPWIIQSGFDTIILPRLASYRLRLKAFSMDQLRQRFARKDDDTLHDIFHFIMKAVDPETGENLSMQELGSEANLMIAAGGDTTSTAIASTFFFLTAPANSHALARVTSEIRNTFATLDDVRPGTQLTSCTYLRACLDESMRIAPPVPSALLREALPGGVTIGAHHFPAGTDLAVPAFAIHRNPAYYADPLVFRPERWLGSPEVSEKMDASTEKSETLRLAQAAFCPFSVGPRNCVGRAMGYLEMTTAMARILWAMDIRREPGNTVGEDHDGTYKMLDGFVAEKFGPWVQFRLRA